MQALYPVTDEDSLFAMYLCYSTQEAILSIAKITCSCATLLKPTFAGGSQRTPASTAAAGFALESGRAHFGSGS